MSIYAQHGHAKADRISLALADGCIDGVILGARNEQPSNVQGYVALLHNDYNCDVLFDPQFYICTLVPPNDRFLPDYSYYSPGRTIRDFIKATNIQDYVKDVLDFEVGLGVDKLIAPTVLFNSFTDRWYQVALQLADASITDHEARDNPPPLLISITLGESALSSRDELDSFLDEITLLDMAGIYLIVARDESSYSQRFDDTRLANLLYLVHVLGDLNDFELVCGYSDIIGIPLRAAGASAIATGWFQTTLRQFHRKTFLKRKSGGTQAKLRYTSGPLLNSVMLSEVQTAFEIGELARIVSGVGRDSIITSAASPEASQWNLRNSEIHHWQTLRNLENQLVGNPKTDIATVLTRVQEADDHYTVLKANGVAFERSTGNDHLTEWLRALQLFKTATGL